MSDYRIERDSLGEVKVPKKALYAAQTQRAIENFGCLQRPMPKAFISAVTIIKQAAARTNAELGCIENEIAQHIELACQQILSEDLSEQSFAETFPVSIFQTGSGTSTNMNVNEVISSIAKRAGCDAINANDDVNYGQSSNDVIPSAIQVASAQAITQHLLPVLDISIKRLTELSEQHQDIVKTGRTHLMDAMPLTLGDEIATWCYQLQEARERIVGSLERLQRLPIGGTAIGTGINRHKEYPERVVKHLTKLTDIEFTACENSASRISAQDPTLEMHGQIKVLATLLIKVANDIRWMNSGPVAGLAEIQLQALQPGSSIMPGKVNPVIAESIIMLATEVIANDTKITLANQSGNFQLNVMLPLIADASLGSIELISHAVRLLTDKLLANFKINQQKLESLVEQNPILVTALNTKIGYQLAATIAKKAQQEGRSVKSVALELTELTEQELDRLLDPVKLAKPFSNDD
jgi:fumarate hydratase, class II